MTTKRKYSLDQEQITCSKFTSPGIIVNDEEVIRFYFTPDDFDGSHISKSAIKVDDLLTRGLSFYRSTYLKPEKRAHFIKDYKDKGTDRRLGAYVSFKAYELRSIKFEEQQAFILIDDAKIDQCSHAMLFFSDIFDDSNPEKPNRRKIGAAKNLRNKLLQIMDKKVCRDVSGLE